MFYSLSQPKYTFRDYWFSHGLSLLVCLIVVSFYPVITKRPVTVFPGTWLYEDEETCLIVRVAVKEGTSQPQLAITYVLHELGSDNKWVKTEQELEKPIFVTTRNMRRFIIDLEDEKVDVLLDAWEREDAFSH